MSANPLKADKAPVTRKTKQELCDEGNQHLMMIGRRDVHWFINGYGQIEIDWIRR